MIAIEEITSAGRFRELEGEWNGSCGSHAGGTPFLSHDWFHSCLSAYGDGSHPLILVARENGSVVGIAPLWRWSGALRGIPAWHVGFIGGPDTPFADFIVSRGLHAEIMDSFARHLAVDRRRDWDILFLSQWPRESPNREPLERFFADSGRRVTQTVSSQAPYVAIQGDWESFLQGRSARFRKTRRNINNRVEKLGNVEILCVREDPTGDRLKEILSVSEKGWKHAEGKAITSRQAAVRFFRELTGRAAGRGFLLAWILKFDGVPVAMEYDLEWSGTVHALRSDFDEAFKEYSPGSYLESHIVEYLFENGYAEYNSGPGMNTYKTHWTEDFKENLSVRVFNNNGKGRFLAILETSVVPLLKRFRDHGR